MTRKASQVLQVLQVIGSLLAVLLIARGVVTQAYPKPEPITSAVHAVDAGLLK